MRFGMNEQKDISSRAWAELLILALLWGGSFLSIRIALDEVGFITVVAHRVVWATLLLWIYIWWRKFPIPRDLRIWAAFLIMGLLNNVIPFSLMSWGQLHIESGLTSILNAATAIFGILVAAMVFRDERLTARRVIGVLLGFFGVAIAIGLENLLFLDLRSLAQLAILAGTVSYALASSWARVTLSDMPPQVAAAGMLTGSSLIILPAAILIEGVPRFDLQADTILSIAYFSLAATALAYLIYYRVLAMAGSGNLMLTTLIIPPIAILLGAWVLDETLNPRAYLGFALLAIGLIVLDGRLERKVKSLLT